LIFDIDGTLADTMPLHYEAWSNVAEKYGFEYPEDLFYAQAGMPSTDIVRHINENQNKNLDAAKVMLEKEENFLKCLDQVKPITAVTDVVYRYYGKLPMSLGSGGSRFVAEKIVRAIGMDRYFSIMVTSDDVENPKPAPDTFLKCARFMGVVPQVCQVFEDGDLGIEAARRAGMIATDIRPFVKK
jgi:beta-phosphoglucomutase family hydrolase